MVREISSKAKRKWRFACEGPAVKLRDACSKAKRKWHIWIFDKNRCSKLREENGCLTFSHLFSRMKMCESPISEKLRENSGYYWDSRYKKGLFIEKSKKLRENSG